MRYKVATRGSLLARTQTGQVIDQLSSIFPKDDFEPLIIKTQADKVQDKALNTLITPGIFVKELEQALLSGEADFAVHSLKDVPSVQPQGLSLMATPKREDDRDVFVFTNQNSLEETNERILIGTSSPRRAMQLKLKYPHLKTVSMRGNIDTRIQKMKSGDCHGIIMAEAGLNRLGLTLPRHIIPKEFMIPAPGQGALAIECRGDDKELIEKLKQLQDPQTHLCVFSERIVMEILEAGCKLPFGANAQYQKGKLNLSVFFGNEETNNWFRKQKEFNFKEMDLGVAGKLKELFEAIKHWSKQLKNQAQKHNILV